MFVRLSKLADPDAYVDDLPETLNITERQVEKYYSVWAYWISTDKKHLISEIMAEPSEATSVVLEIDDYYNKIVHQLRNKDSDDGSGEN